MSLLRDRIGKRALVVEDNPMNARLFSDLLEGLGCEVFQANTARKASSLHTDVAPI